MQLLWQNLVLYPSNRCYDKSHTLTHFSKSYTAGQKLNQQLTRELME